MKAKALGLLFGAWAMAAGGCGESGGDGMPGAGGAGGGAPGGIGGGAPGGVGGGAPGGAGGTPIATPNVSGSKRLNELTASEKGTLCDWGASLYGGYDKRVTCADGTTSRSSSSHDDCVADDLSSCSATVDEFLPCALKIRELCASALSTQECVPLFVCFN